MLKEIMDYSFLFFVLIGLITHVLKLIYLFFKPAYMSKFQYFSNETPSKLDLILYYILTIGCCFYIIFKYFN